MPRRKKLSSVEVLILMAILGILFSIIMPSAERAKRQAQRARSAPVVERTTGEGQLNTIEVSELSERVHRHNPMQWFGVLLGLAPVIFAMVVIFTIFGRLRRRMSRRA